MVLERQHRVVKLSLRGFLRRVTGQRMMHRCGERIDVAPSALQFGVERVLLRRRVSGFDDRAERVAVLAGEVTGGAEVDQHRFAVRPDDDVVRGDVAMKELLRVDRVQRRQDRLEQVVQFRLCRRAAELLQPALQVLALLELEDHVGGAELLDQADHTNDVLVAEAAEHARLLDEVAQAVGEEITTVRSDWMDCRRSLAVRELRGEILLDGDLAL